MIQTTINEEELNAFNKIETLKCSNINLDKNGRESNIVNFYNGRSVLITGASGFIGKVLIEKILRVCPNLNRVFVLIRPKWNKQPKDRLEELLRSPLFDGLRDTGTLEKKLVLVEGDVTLPNLGFSDENLAKVLQEVSVIFHSAATVKFDEPLKQSVKINISGTKNIIDICRKANHLAALVHVSTAYANCDKHEIDEHVYPIDMDPENMINIASWLDNDALQAMKAKLLGQRPNTYTYTKALAEWLLVQCARDLPVAVCRPSIVTASWKDPFGGWIDNLNGPTGIVLGAGKGLIRSMRADRNLVADLVPVDLVANMIIALGWFANIYQNFKKLNERAQGSPVSFNDSSSGIVSSMDEDDEDRPLNIGVSNNINGQSSLQPEDKRDNDSNNNGTNMDSVTFIANRNYHNTNSSQKLDQSSHSSISRTETPEILIESLSYNRTNKHSGDKRDFGRSSTQIQENSAEMDAKLRKFRNGIQKKLVKKDLPEAIGDIPVFHCTSGAINPITWGKIQTLILTFWAIFPSISVYRYPGGSFTTYKLLDNALRMVLHYIPAYIIDFMTRLKKGKPILVKIFEKFDQASEVLKAFTLKQWKFQPDNQLTLMNEFMTDEDRLIFSYDIEKLDWKQYMRDYVLGIKKFVLNEPMSNLKEARTNLKIVYYRNLSLEILFSALVVYYFFKA